jgi:hypothetical protein
MVKGGEAIVKEGKKGVEGRDGESKGREEKGRWKEGKETKGKVLKIRWTEDITMKRGMRW